MKKKETKTEQHRATLLMYLENPENKWLTRQELSTQVLGFKQENQIYKVFDVDEIYEIELKAIDLRRKKYTRLLSAVDIGLLKKAAKGDPQAAKLAY